MALRAQRKTVAARAETTEGTQVDAEKVIKDLQEKVRACRHEAGGGAWQLSRLNVRQRPRRRSAACALCNYVLLQCRASVDFLRMRLGSELTVT